MSASPLQPFGPDLWLADGPQANVAGFKYPTRMAIIRLTGGELLAWSPLSLSPAVREALADLGEVRHLVAPNSLHHLFLGEWKAAYPLARLYAPPGLAAKRGDLAFDVELGDTPPAAWSADLDLVLVRGNRITTEAVVFHRPSATVLFTDLIQQFPPGWFKGWRGLVAKLDLMTEAEPAVPRKFRVAFTDRGVARSALRRILAWPARKVVMAHGQPVEQDGQAFLARAFRWLMP
jgi:hypothetical protein